MPEVIAAGVTYAASAIGVSLSATAVSVASWAIVTALSLGASYQSRRRVTSSRSAPRICNCMR